jgi:hypothetical protein
MTLCRESADEGDEVYAILYPAPPYELPGMEEVLPTC